MTNNNPDNIDVQADDVVKYKSLIIKNNKYKLVEQGLFSNLTNIIDSNIVINDNSSILEVGFGDGSRLKQINVFYKGAKVVGLEVRQSCVDNMVKDGYDCRLVTNEIFEMDDKFDVIYGFQIIHHISTPYDYLAHLYSLLKPGGLLIFPHEAYSTNFLSFIIVTIQRHWKFESNLFKLSKNKIIQSCSKYSNNYNICYNGTTFLYAFPRLHSLYRFLRFHKLPFINDLSICIKKDF
ncbi:MAG: class I SAM-dependent methyltransferase [Deltaproteobacteria bacterium]|jgi:SAM-dependent methyltransferase|nr:class I SAM-dependent methyltransferase [Deltaproteobacteria bacterium]